MPHALFCSPVWGILSDANCRLFDNSLLRCVKLILHNPKAVINKDTFESVSVVPFKQHFFIRNVFNVFNVLKENECAHYLPSEYFLTIPNIILDSMMDGKLKPLSLIDSVTAIIL